MANVKYMSFELIFSSIDDGPMRLDEIYRSGLFDSIKGKYNDEDIIALTAILVGRDNQKCPECESKLDDNGLCVAQCDRHGR